MSKKKKKRKIKIKSFLVLFVLIFIITFFCLYKFNSNVPTVYVLGNTILSDEEVIKLANVSNNIINNSSLNIKNRLEKNKYILSAEVKIKNFYKEMYITIEENKPLFYYKEKTVLKDGTLDEKKYIIPTVINEINSDIYKSFVKKMALIDEDILTHVSEIKYDPNEVDNSRFLFTMTDGNYVYLTLKTFENINQYLTIIKNFESKKGILYLDSGKYFEVFE